MHQWTFCVCHCTMSDVCALIAVLTIAPNFLSAPLDTVCTHIRPQLQCLYAQPDLAANATRQCSVHASNKSRVQAHVIQLKFLCCKEERQTRCISIVLALC